MTNLPHLVLRPLPLPGRTPHPYKGLEGGWWCGNRRAALAAPSAPHLFKSAGVARRRKDRSPATASIGRDNDVTNDTVVPQVTRRIWRESTMSERRSQRPLCPFRAHRRKFGRE